jgi:hypothetical protein
MPESTGRLRGWAANWGAEPEELGRSLPCDRLLPDAAIVVHRAVSVDAHIPLVYRWLCQLRAAPYSYDLLDNLGRRSPQQLTPGLDRLEPGQRVMTMFRLDSFERDEHLTLRHSSRATGRVAVTFTTRPRWEGTRLLARFRVTPSALGGPLRESLLTAWAVGDRAMTRRQLLNLKALAERDERSAATAS